MAQDNLYDKVSELRDEFIQFRRFMEDAIENIDTDNLSGNLLKIITDSESSSAGFEAAASELGAYSRMFAEYKNETNKALAEIISAADSQSAKIKALTEWQSEFVSENGDLTKLYAAVTSLQEASSEYALKSEITSFVTQEYVNDLEAFMLGQIDDMEFSLTENLTAISQRANASGAFIDIFASSGAGFLKKDAEGNYVLTENGEYIYCTSSDTDGVPVSESDIPGMFISTFNNGGSSIKFRADLISFGDFAGVQNGNFYTDRLFGTSDVVVNDSYPGVYYAVIDSNFQPWEGSDKVGADLLIKRVPDFSDGIISSDTDLMYGFSYGITDGEDGFSVNFIVGESESYDSNAPGPFGQHSVIGYNYRKNKVYPKGTWDFGSCEVINLGVVPVFG